MRYALALFLGSVAGLIAALQPIADTDMWWHLATGRETLAHGIVRADVFSWSVRGAPVSTDQWLGQVVMYATWLAAGWRGIALLRVVLVIGLVAFVALGAARTATRPLAVTLATIPALLLTRAVWVDRPELFGFTFFAALLFILRVGRDGGRRQYLMAVLLLGIWANVHGSFALGVAVTVLACLERAWRDDPRRRAHVAAAIAAVAVTLANPAGVGVWTAPGLHLLSPPRDIQEWNLIDIGTPLGSAYAATLVLVVLSALAGPRLPLRDAVILVPVALLSLTAVRQAPLIAVAAAPLLADRAERLITRAGLAAARRRGGVSPLAFVPALVVTLVALFSTPARPDERAYPVAAVGSLPSGDGTLARYEWGGWLIWHGVPVFVDGRLTPYLGALLDDYRRIVAAGPGWEDAVRRQRVRTLLVVGSDPVATRARDLGWSVRAFEGDAVVITVP